jgi:hypothetical protein
MKGIYVNFLFYLFCLQKNQIFEKDRYKLILMNENLNCYRQYVRYYRHSRMFVGTFWIVSAKNETDLVH